MNASYVIEHDEEGGDGAFSMNNFLVADTAAIASIDSDTPWLWALETFYDTVDEDEEKFKEKFKDDDDDEVLQGAQPEPKYHGYYKVLASCLFSDFWPETYELAPMEQWVTSEGDEFFGPSREFVFYSAYSEEVAQSHMKLLQTQYGWSPNIEVRGTL